jgi:TRAP transporter TAXI family solute receptor
MKKLSIIGLSVAMAAGAAALFTSPAPSAAADQTFVTIGTGGVTGVYYPAGGAICRLLNQGRKEHGIRCSVESTGGSVYNINTIRAGELDFGVAQSDWQYHAYHGTSQFADAGAFEDLRAVFSMHPEPMTLVVRSDAGINSYADLKGKRVNIGNPGSGARATVDVMLKESGIDPEKDFTVAAELAAAEQAGALCDNKVDAIFFSVGHPSGTIKEATTACDSKLVDITGPGIDKMVEDNAFYSWATIPGGMYRGTDNDVKTFGVRATLVTSAKVPDEVVYELVKSVFENFDSFKKLHPAFGNLTKEEMVSASLSAPLHPGAAKYYKEVGLIK